MIHSIYLRDLVKHSKHDYTQHGQNEKDGQQNDADLQVPLFAVVIAEHGLVHHAFTTGLAGHVLVEVLQWVNRLNPVMGQWKNLPMEIYCRSSKSTNRSYMYVLVEVLQRVDRLNPVMSQWKNSTGQSTESCNVTMKKFNGSID